MQILARVFAVLAFNINTLLTPLCFCLFFCLCLQRVGVFVFAISVLSLLEVVQSKDDCLKETSKPNKGPLC